MFVFGSSEDGRVSLVFGQIEGLFLTLLIPTSQTLIMYRAPV